MTFDAWTTATSRVFGRSGGTHIVRRNKTLAVARDIGDVDVGVFAQCSQRPQHGVVVANGRDDMVARPDDAANGEVQHVGAVEAEDDVRRIVGADQFGHAAPGPLDDAVGLQRFAIAAAAVRGADFALVAIDGVVDGLRLGPGRGGVVEIDAVRMDH